MLDHRTLLLDATYKPIRVISWMRAVALDFADKVSVVETYDTIVRSPSIELAVPAVVALHKFHGYRPFRVRYSKRNVFIRDGHTCQYCGKKLSAADLTLDHVIPSSRGGKSVWENVVAACEPCNHRKGDRTPDEAGMPLLSRPEKPTPLTHSQMAIQSAPPQWHVYLAKAG